MKYKLVAIDMDGTLLNSRNQVSKRTKIAIREAMDRGVYILLSTGRILKSATKYSEELGLKNPMITCNGAIIVDENNKIIYERPMEREIVREIIDLLDKKDIYYHFYDKEKFYSRERVEEVLKFYNESGNTFKIDLETFSSKDEIFNDKDIKTYKFIFIDEDKNKLNKLRDELDRLEGVETSSSWVNNIEAMANGVSKGSSLKILCDKLDIGLEEVIAIGDGENDLSMLNLAGLSVAMGNAGKLVKESSHIVTDTNDNDGVAKIIEKYILT